MKENISLLEHFKKLEDPRSPRNQLHSFSDVIVITICGIICGATTWIDIVTFAQAKQSWLKDTLGLALLNGIPSNDTFGRIFSLIKPDALQECFSSWLESITKVNEGEIIAIDGKTLRRSHDSNKSAAHILNAMATESGLCIGQLATEEKSNEITAIPELLKTLTIKGCIVTIDAMGCQKEIAQTIIKSSAQYVLALKGNQGALHSSVSCFLEKAYLQKFKNINHSYYETAVEKDHGRIEQRFCWVVPVKPYANYFEKINEWSNLKSIVLVESKVRIVKTKEERREKRFYITSLEPDAELLARAIRRHWMIESSLHWSLDVVFREDDSRIRIGESPVNFSTCRQIARNYLKNETTCKNGISAKQLKAALDDSYREKVLGLSGM